jgi:hypothetical protein
MIFYIVFSCFFVPSLLWLFFAPFIFKMLTPLCHHPLPPVAPAAPLVFRPQRPLSLFSLLVPVPEPSGSLVRVTSPSVSPAIGALAHQLCLRCAKLAARRPEASCEFDKSNSEKCRYCLRQKTSFIDSIRLGSQGPSNLSVPSPPSGGWYQNPERPPSHPHQVGRKVFSWLHGGPWGGVPLHLPGRQTRFLVWPRLPLPLPPG